MPKKRKSALNKQVFGDLAFLAVAVVCVLAIIVMYMNYRHKKAQFTQNVQSAIESETVSEIQSGKVLEDIVGENEP